GAWARLLSTVGLLISSVAIGLASCRPSPEAGDPRQLRWDEKELDGMSQLLKLSRVNGVRVLFWNLAWSSLNQDHSIEWNLNQLISSNARPDLVILAEHKPDAMAEGDLATLSGHYP